MKAMRGHEENLVSARDSGNLDLAAAFGGG